MKCDDDTYVVGELLYAEISFSDVLQSRTYESTRSYAVDERLIICRYLNKLNPEDPHYLGKKLTRCAKYITSQGRKFVIGSDWPQPIYYNSGGAGYVFSRATLRAYVGMVIMNKMLLFTLIGSQSVQV